LLAGLDLIAIGGSVIDQACELGEPLLRSVDAIHLASALTIGEDLAAFVAYDLRLADAAESAGLRPLTPGR
jgi:predicted nucleic acid-binding protein